MAVTDEQVALLRAYLTEDDTEYRRLSEQPSTAYPQNDYGIFVASVFLEAVTRHFSKGSLIGDVIRFVAEVRAKYVEDPNQLNPLGAERLIRAALGDYQAVTGLDDTTKAQCQVILLPALIDEEDDAAVDALLGRARERADSLGA